MGPQSSIAHLAERARSEDRDVLLEPEGQELLESLGLTAPRFLYFEASRLPTAEELTRLPGEKAVLKVVSPRLLHKAAAGGVRWVAKTPSQVATAVRELERRLTDWEIRGFTLHEHIPYEPVLGREVLVGMRWSPEFGPIVLCSLGGGRAESLARGFATPSIASPHVTTAAAWADSVAEDLLGSAAPIEEGRSVELEDALRTFHRAALQLLPEPFSEVEINPLVFHGGRWLALDVLARLTRSRERERPPRPLKAIQRLLRPRSIAVVGVSRGANPGRQILRNVLDEGFDPERVYVVQHNATSLEGARWVPDLAALPAPVDLLIVALRAEQAVEVAEKAIQGALARSLILISGGLGETAGSQPLAERLEAAIGEARSREGGGPVLNGPNCLGIRSVPGSYDSLFIPRHKLAPARRRTSDATFISQSGALLVAKLSRLPGVAFRYCISVGNQSDLTIGDYVEALKDDPNQRLFAIYAEGLRDGDGLRLLRAAADIRRRGGTVLLYRGGRAPAGVAAAAGHTATIAGDYAVAGALARAAGITVAETLGEFEGLLQLFATLEPPRGRRVAVVTNAGFESVAASDHLGSLELAVFNDATRNRLGSLLRSAGLESVVGCSNPLDLTPMADDRCFAAAVKIALEDPGVDAVLVGCVPLTPALHTLPRGAGHSEALEHPDSLAQRLIRLRRQTAKPWLVAVDGGADFEPMRSLLRAGGLPTLGRIDEAARLLETFCAAHLGEE